MLRVDKKRGALQVRYSPQGRTSPLFTVRLAVFPITIILAFRLMRAVLIGFVVVLLISLAAFLVYIFTLPSDRRRWS